MLETALVIAIIVAAAAFLVLRFVRNMDKPCAGDCPGCAGAPNMGVKPLCGLEDDRDGCPARQCSCACREKERDGS